MIQRALVRRHAAACLILVAACSSPKADPRSDTPRTEDDAGAGDAGEQCGAEADRAPAPFCDERCSDACGCAPCMLVSPGCTDTESGSYTTKCAQGGLCIEKTPCAADEVCGRPAAHFQECVPAGQISGQATGLTQPLTLAVVWSAGVVGNGGHVLVPLAGDGPFVSPKIARDAGYAITIDPPMAGCSVSHARGNIASPDSAQIKVSCGAASPCDDAGYSCFQDTSSCPYEVTVVSANGGSTQPTESATLSCAADGSATPTATCCRVAK